MVVTEAVFTLYKKYNPPLSTGEETSRKWFCLLHFCTWSNGKANESVRTKKES